MRDLKGLSEEFDETFTDYANEPYNVIIDSIKRLRKIDPDIVGSDYFRQICDLMDPIILVRNYKAQTPFPKTRDWRTIIESMAALASISERDPGNKKYRDIFATLIQVDGFQLPTVSALFHFTRPTIFPIVDRNVEAACKGLLKTTAKLPLYNHTAEVKYQSYLDFIDCIANIITVQRNMTRNGEGSWPATSNDYRSIDKALMVFGAKELKKRKREKP